MTDPKQHWRVERGPDWFLVMDGGHEVARVSAHSERAEADAAHVVELHNDAATRAEGTGAEPAADRDRIGQCITGAMAIAVDCDDLSVAEHKALCRALNAATRVIYAAPPAPELPAEVEWRVSEDLLNYFVRDELAQVDCSATNLMARDLRDARAALDRRPDPTPAGPFDDHCCVPRPGEPFFVLLGRDRQAPAVVEKWATDREAAKPGDDKIAGARARAAEMRAYSGALTSDPTPATPVIDETRRLLDADDDWWCDQSITATFRSILAEHDAVAADRPGAGGWRDIASAPVDGSYILLGGCKSGPKVRIGSWGCGRYDRSKRDYMLEWTSGPNDYGFEPTHWMPLPAPPADDAGGAR